MAVSINNVELLENVLEKKHDELKNRVDLGLKYSLLNTKEYNKAMNDLNISIYDSATLNDSSNSSLLDFIYKKFGEDDENNVFKPYFNELKNESYLKKIEYINSLNLDEIPSEIADELKVLLNRYSNIVKTNNYLKSKTLSIDSDDIFESLEITLTQNIDNNNKETVLKHHLRLIIDYDFRKNNLNGYFNKKLRNSNLIDNFELNKESFEKVYQHGFKTKVLDDIIRHILINNEDAYLPKEIMDFIELNYDFISFSESNNPNKVYVNKGTFSSVWYKVKKELKENIVFTESKLIENSLTDIITGSDENDLIFENLSSEQLISLIPDYNALLSIKNEGVESILFDLNPLLENNEWKYSMLNGTNLKSTIYPAFFKKLENDFKNEIIANTSKENLINFCKKYYDNFILHYRTDENLNVKENINAFSSLSLNLLGLPENDSAISSFYNNISSFIAASNNPSILTLGVLKEKLQEEIKKKKNNNFI